MNLLLESLSDAQEIGTQTRSLLLEGEVPLCYWTLQVCHGRRPVLPETGFV